MKKIIVANWKMNPQTLEEARVLVSRTEHRMHQAADKTEVVICVPFIFLPPLNHYCGRIKLGSQNVSWLEKGALTGEVSAMQLREFKVSHVLLGHSERRLYLGETDSMVNAKIITALKYKLTPIVCLGASEGAKKTDMKKLVAKQFRAVTDNLADKLLQKIIFVYEPAWAISTMKNSAAATGEHAAELVSCIQKLTGGDSRVLYGGTVNQGNVHEYAMYPQIDGALVGAASLDSENFWAIIKEFHRESIHR